MTPQPLSRLLDPASIAIVGASTSADKAGYQAVNSLRGFTGRLFPINPRATEVLGHSAYPSLGAARNATGVAADLAILAIPSAGCLDALRDAAEAGCGGAMIISGGFGESGAEGARLQDEIGALCRDSGLRLLGPNTSGFMRPRTGCTASFAPGVEQLRPGKIAVVAQSGGVNLTLAFLLHRSGQGISLAVGLGNAIDVDATEMLEYLAGDADTRAIALHLEGVAQGRRLYEALCRITPAKPVVAVTVGRAEIGAFAQSHTGRLIGSWERKLAALKQAGVVVVQSTDEVADAVSVLSSARIRPSPDPGIGVLTAQAGPGLLIVDNLRAAGVSVPELAAETVQRIGSLLPPLTFMRNPVDTGRPGPGFPQVLRALADDAAIDAVAMFTLHEPAAVDAPAVLFEAAGAIEKPIVFGTIAAPDAMAATLAALGAIGVPCLTSPERLALAATVLVNDAKAQYRLGQVAAAQPPVQGISALAGAIDEAAAKALLATYGIASPKSTACGSHDEARTAFAAMDKPLAAKILSAEVAHKTEAGGVRLNLRTDAELADALAQLDRIPLRGVRRYLLEEMAPPGVELIIGALRDASFGPVVVLGMGGVAAEAMQDTAVRLAPLAPIDAGEMLDELRGRALLGGFRGSAPVDRGAIVRTLLALSRLMQEHPEIGEIDVNPLRAYPDGVLALDALIAISPDTPPA